MITFTKEELLKIAQLSGLKLETNEVDSYTQQIGSILEYVEQLKEVTITTEAQSLRSVNVMREDVSIRSDSAAIRSQAPEVDETFFAVPKILDEK